MLPKGSIIPVAGVTFHQGAVKQTSVGDIVVLKHTPENVHDVFAVEMEISDIGVIGFVPSSLNRRFSDPQHGGVAGGAWEGVVVEKLRHEDVEGLRIKIIGEK